MALTNLQQAFQVSGSGFDRKLSAIVGIGQSIKQSQVAKQQMAEQIERQKELIEFRADTQLDKEMEYYDRVKKPMLEAEQKQELTQAWKEAQKEATDTIEQKKKDFYERFPNASSLGLATTDFIPEINEQTGQIEIQTYLNGEQVSTDKYEQTLQEYEDFGKWVKDLERKAGELDTLTEKEREQVDDTFNVIDGNNVNKIVRGIYNNEYEKERWFQRWKDRSVKTTEQLSYQRDSDPDDLPAEFREIGSKYTNLMSSLSTNGTFSLSVDKGWFSGSSELNLNFRGENPDTVIGARRKIEKFVESFDMNPLALNTEEGRQEIYTALEDEISPTVIRDMFNIYQNIKDISDIYSRSVLPEGKSIDLNKTYINPNFITSPNNNPRDILIETPLTEQEWVNSYNQLR